jgi:hypothetical protein
MMVAAGLGCGHAAAHFFDFMALWAGSINGKTSKIVV